MDRFVIRSAGLLLLHGYGNVFERVLRPGESIMLEPGAFLTKTPSSNDECGNTATDHRFFGGTGMNLAG